MNKLLEGVTVEYKEVIPTNRQMAEFYTWQQGADSYATITYLDRVVEVERNGDMYLCLLDLLEDGTISEDERVVKYSDDLISAGIKDDIQLMQYIKTMGHAGYSVYHENPWWEVFSHNIDMGEIYDTFYEAVDGAIEYIKDDNNWV